MNKFINFLRTTAKGDIKGLSILNILFVVVAALGIIILWPLTLVWGLQLLGLPVEASLKSWLGSVLIMAFLAIKRTGNENK